MRLHKENLSTGISLMIFICLTIQVAQTLSAFTDVPRKSRTNELARHFRSCISLAPPTRPQQFRSREELKRYLQLV